MNNLTSRQRKLFYAVGIIVLLLPIVWLGFPVQQSPDGTAESNLGKLGNLRQKYDLGEATLGSVDPTSSVMNLVLLGLRGPAASVLHLKAIDYQERKQWSKLRSTVDSIILLQPHYVQIWKFQGWNLAYNVSREWDKVDDRFYWVKEGIKFMQRGTNRNESVPILEHDTGDMIEKKMGVSDEKKFFREFFVRDPEDRFQDAVTSQPGPDKEINPRGIDSYLVARDHYIRANEKDDNDGILGVRGMTHEFFRQGPAKSLMNYADAMTKEGRFDGDSASDADLVIADDSDSDSKSRGTFTQAQWTEARRQWLEDYGRYSFLGRDNHLYKLNSTEEDLRVMADQNGISLEEQRGVHAAALNMVNYRQWRDYSEMESDPIVVDAHRAFFDAKKAYNEGRGYNVKTKDGGTEISEAQKLLELSMQRWLEASARYSKLYTDNVFYLEEALMTARYWKAVHQNNGVEEPNDYPLKETWETHAEKHNEINTNFLIDTRSNRNK